MLAATPLFMPMPMMNIGKVRMLVRHRFVDVRMGVRLTRINVGWVFVLVMFIMAVPVRVFQEFMRMLVFVLFGQVQPDSTRHQ